MKLYYALIACLMLTPLQNTATEYRAPLVKEETNNAGKLISYFLRDVLGGIVGLKASQGNPEAAAACLKQVLHGTAGLVETVLEEQRTRGILSSMEEFEKIMEYIQIIIHNSLSSTEGQQAFLLFLEELKNIEHNNK